MAQRTTFTKAVAGQVLAAAQLGRDEHVADVHSGIFRAAQFRRRVFLQEHDEISLRARTLGVPQPAKGTASHFNAQYRESVDLSEYQAQIRARLQRYLVRGQLHQTARTLLLLVRICRGVMAQGAREGQAHVDSSSSSSQ